MTINGPPGHLRKAAVALDGAIETETEPTRVEEYVEIQARLFELHEEVTA